MNKIKFIQDKRFSIDNSIKYGISIQLSESGFTTLFQEIEKKIFLAIHTVSGQYNHNSIDYYDGIKEYMKETIFRYPYNILKVIVTDKRSTLIPETLFVESKIKNFFLLNHRLNDDEELHFYKLKQYGFYIVFPVPSFISSLYANRLDDAILYHQGIPFLESVLSLQKAKNVHERVYVNFHRTFFDAAVVKSNKLLLYNTFFYADENDMVYFIMLLYDQLQLNTEINELVLMGTILKQSEGVRMLSNYIRHISFMDFSSINDNLSYIFEDIDCYIYSNLFSVFSCE
ncbi:MAG: DUF3822 family protein [Bacteroidales bacterium]